MSCIFEDTEGKMYIYSKHVMEPAEDGYYYCKYCGHKETL